MVAKLTPALSNPSSHQTSGWWTVFRTPSDSTQWMLENYATVLSTEGLVRSFRNSQLISIPATTLPITVAAFAA